jgi:hypothetical protein
MEIMLVRFVGSDVTEDFDRHSSDRYYLWRDFRNILAYLNSFSNALSGCTELLVGDCSLGQ